MSNALTISKKAFTWTVVVATIAWAMSAAFIALPLTAQAAELNAGDLIRGTVKSPYGGYPVYYYGSDGKRHLFPTQSTYASWFGTDFSAVRVITEAEVGALPLGNNVTIKPGSKLVKEEGPDPKVYAVDASGARRHVASEAVAQELYGADWAEGIVQIPTGFFVNYSDGSAVNAAADYNKAAVTAAATDIGTDMGLAATPAPAAATGALSAALASNNPGAQVLPGNAASAVVLKFNLTAGSTAQTVSSVTIKSVGVGSSNDFSNVYLFDGATRLTSGRTLASQTRSTEFAALNVSVPANGSKTLSVVVDTNSLTTGTTATAGDTHAFQLIAVGTTASVAGLPLTGATNSIGSQNVSTVTLQRGTDPANPTIGEAHVPIAEFRLTAGANDTTVQRITVTVNGTVTVSDLTNVSLYQASTKLADGVAVGTDRFTFDLSGAPYALGQGVNRLFTVKADVGGRGSRTVTTYVDSTYPSDILVVDKVFGYGSSVTFTSFASARTGSTACDAAAGTQGSCVATLGGRVTVAFNGPPAADVQRGAQDAELYKFSLTAGEQALEVREIEMTLQEAGTDVDGALQGSSATNYFTDIKIKDAETGATLMGPVELSNATLTNAASLTAASSAVWDNDFTQTWTLAASSTRRLVVTADISNSEDAAGELFAQRYAMVLRAFPTASIREVSTGQNVATTDIIGGQQAITGNTMTVQSAALTVTVASTPISGTTVKGSTGVESVGFAFAAGSASDVTVTQVIVRGFGDTDDDGAAGPADDTDETAANLDDIVLSARLYDGDTPVSDQESPNSSGVITFDNMLWSITKGQTKKLVVRTNLSTTLLNSNVDLYYLYIGNGDITANDEDSNALASVPAADVNVTSDDAVAATVYTTINNSGSITAALDGDTPLSNIVTGGTNDVSMLKVRMIPAQEGFWLKDLRIVNDAAGDDTGVSLIKIKYPKKDGTTGTATSVLSAAVANFNDLDAYLKRDAVNVLEVLADYTTISESGISGDTPQFAFDFDSNFEAVGEGSGETLTSVGSANITGNAMTVRKTKPTVTLHAASPSGAASQQVDVEILRFTVTANSVGDTELGRVTFRTNFTANAAGSTWNEPVTGSAITECNTSGLCTDTASRFDASNIRIYDAADISTQLTGVWRLFDQTSGGLASGEDVGYAQFNWASAETISAGGSKTYVVRVDVSGLAPGSDDSVGLTIVDDASATLTTGTSTSRGSSFVWGEIGSGATVLTVGTSDGISQPTAGIGGALVKNLPITGGTLVY